MKSGKWIKRRVAFSIPTLFTVLLVCTPLLLAQEDSLLNRKIILGGDRSYAPNEHLDQDGKPTGFNVELAKAIANEMGLDIEIRLDEWHKTYSALESGKIDGVIGLVYSLERAKRFYFSRPHSHISSVIIVRSENRTIKSEKDLNDKEIVVQKGDVMHEYVLGRNLTERLYTVTSPDSTLIFLSQGKYDAALIDHTQFYYLTEKLGITNLRVIPEPLFSNEYCFAALNDNRFLIPVFNEGLMRLREDGTYNFLFNKWFGDCQTTPSYDGEKTFRYVMYVLIPLLFITILIFIWSVSLKAKVAAKTEELNLELEAHLQTAIEQARLERIKDSMLEVSEAIHKSGDLTEFFTLVHKIIANSMPAESFYVAILDDETKQLRFPYYTEHFKDMPTRRASAKGMTEYVMKIGNPTLIKKAEAEKLVKEGLVELYGKLCQAWLGVPFKINETHTGLIALQDNENPDIYDDKDVQILSFISEQIALAIERKNYQESLKTTIDDLELRVLERTNDLRISEQAYRTITETSLDIIMRFDRDCRMLYVNSAISRVTELEAHNCIGKTFPELGFPPDLCYFWEEAIREVFKKGKTNQLEFELPNHIWIDWHLSPEVSPDGRVNTVVTSAHDITQRIRYQKQIHALNENLEAIIQERTEQLIAEINIKKENEKIQRALYLISESVHKAQDIQGLYLYIHQTIKELMVADNFTIAQYYEESDLLVFPYNDNQFDETPLPKKPGNGLTEYVFKSGQPLLATREEVEKLAESGKVRVVGETAEIWLGIPLRIKDKIIGVLIVQDYENPAAYGEKEKQILTFVSEQIALAIEQKEAEYSIKRQKVLFEQLFNSMPVGIVLLSNKDAITEANQGFLELFGYEREETVGQPINSLIVPSGLTGEAERLTSKARSGEIIEKETTRVTKKGELKYVRIYGIPIFIDGEKVGVYGIYVDLTPLQNALSSLDAEKEKLSVMLKSIGDGVIAVATTGRIVLMNRVAQDLTGWSEQEAVDNKAYEVFNIIDESNQGITKALLDDVLRTAELKATTNHTNLVSRDNTVRQIEFSLSPISDKESTLVGVIIVFRDVTEKKRTEEELNKNAKLESIGILAGGIAHDFNNILTAILGNISFARNLIGSGNPKLTERLKEAEKSSLRAKDLTTQLLTYAKGGDPVMLTTSIGDLLMNSVKHLSQTANLSCDIEIPKKLFSTKIDAGQISQVVNNVLLNAKQSGSQTIKLKVENCSIYETVSPTFKKGQYVKITIIDKGIGIPQPLIHRIFDPFFTTKENCSGLGLTTSYSIIKKHKGHILVESEINQGTKVTIYLPAQETVKTKKISTTKVTKKSGNGTILVMDDDLVLIEVVTEMLSSLGYNVITANEGRETVAKYKELHQTGKAPEVVILDLTIPGGMGGKDTVKALVDYDPDVVCIVSSGYSADPVMAEYEKYGFKDVLGKPYSFKQLGETIKRVITENRS